MKTTSSQMNKCPNSAPYPFAVYLTTGQYAYQNLFYNTQMVFT